jgi:hypothetical protein
MLQASAEAAMAAGEGAAPALEACLAAHPAALRLASDLGHALASADARGAYAVTMARRFATSARATSLRPRASRARWQF